LRSKDITKVKMNKSSRKPGEKGPRHLTKPPKIRERYGSDSVYLRLLESIPDAMVIVDGDGRIMLVNNQTEKLFGYNRDELIGEPIETLMPERLWKLHIQHRNGYISQPRTRDMGVGLDLVGRCKDGREFPVEISLSPMETENELLITSVIRDITDRKWAAEVLRVSEERFRTLVNSVDDIVFTLDREQRYIGVFGQWLGKQGIPTADFFGKTAREILGADASAVHEAANQRALSGKHVVYEWSTEGSTGTQHFQTSLSPIRDSKGVMTGVVGVVRNITDLKRAAEEIRKLNRELEKRVKERTSELQEEKALLQKYFDVAAVMIVVIGADQKVALINKNGCEVLGYKESEVLGENWFDLFVPEPVRDDVRASFLKLMAGEIEPVEYFQNPVLTKSGEERMIVWHNTVLRDEDGKIYSTLSSGEDITEKVELERQVRQAEKLAAAGQLTSGLAHEIGTPLNVIAGRAEYMLRKMPPQDPLRENLERIIHQIERITKIVNQLLSFTRRKPLEIRPARLAPMLQEVLSLFEHQIIDHRITVRLDCSEGLPEIMADPDQIQQVLFNIILNAIQAMSQGGNLNVCVEQTIPRRRREDPIKDQYIKILISDTGIGIPPEHLPKLFDPYFTTKEVGKGTGLGLAVSYGIVRDHGGWIAVNSRVGEGAAFSIYLPLRQDSRISRVLSGEQTYG
jgi:PAS domain S-box-containing protein